MRCEPMMERIDQRTLAAESHAAKHFTMRPGIHIQSARSRKGKGRVVNVLL